MILVDARSLDVRSSGASLRRFVAIETKSGLGRQSATTGSDGRRLSFPGNLRRRAISGSQLWR